MRARFRAGLLRIHSRGVTAYQVFVKSILKITVHSILVVKTSRIRLVVAEQQFRFAFAVKPILAEFTMACADRSIAHRAQLGLRRACLPGPRVPKPELG